VPRYFEDLQPGDAFESPQRTVTEAEIIAFAREFDPQPFHLDPEAARTSFFGGLVASGWHTAALTMRNFVDAGLDLAGGIVGAGTEYLRWPAPLPAGDTIRTRITIERVRPSERRPEIGIVTFRIDTLRSDGKPVLEMSGSLFVPRRTGSGGERPGSV
jgi:acyl dehydratase